MGPAPPSARLRIVSEAGRLRLEMVGSRNLGASLVIALWLVGWGYGELLVARRLFFTESAESGSWFLAVWLLLWTAGGLLALGVLVRSLAGSEIVAVEGRTLSLRRAPLGRTRRYDVGLLRALRIVPPVAGEPPDRNAVFTDPEAPREGPGRPAALAFDCAGRTVRFGAGLTTSELEAARAALAGRLPSESSAVTRRTGTPGSPA